MIYLDNNATTAPLPSVIQAVTDAMQTYTGNPSSAHGLGTVARRALESAREQIAHHFGAGTGAQVVFTSGGTESINTALCRLACPAVSQIVVPGTEHSAVLRAVERWRGGRPVEQARVSTEGVLDLDHLTGLVSQAPSLVTVAAANNETGVVIDSAAVSQICRRHGALLHIDAVQAAGKIPFHFGEVDCDAASLSAHKFHGPKGCGVLLMRLASRYGGGASLLPGSQEHGLRGGVENLPAVLGTAAAVAALHDDAAAMAGVSDLRDQLESTLLASIFGSAVHARSARRLPNTISLYCPNRNASDLVSMLSRFGVAASSGAACSTGNAPSHVIRAMGFPAGRANSTLRLSLSRFTTATEIEEASTLIPQAYKRTLASNHAADAILS